MKNTGNNREPSEAGNEQTVMTTETNTTETCAAIQTRSVDIRGKTKLPKVKKVMRSEDMDLITCLICSTLSYIGWTSINVFSISSESQFIGASRIVFSSIWWIAACVRLSSRQRLRSANRRQLVVPRHRRSKFGRRSFSVAAPMVWNSFPDSLRDPALSIDNLTSALKTHLFAAQRDT